MASMRSLGFLQDIRFRLSRRVVPTVVSPEPTAAPESPEGQKLEDTRHPGASEADSPGTESRDANASETTSGTASEPHTEERPEDRVLPFSLPARAPTPERESFRSGKKRPGPGTPLESPPSTTTANLDEAGQLSFREAARSTQSSIFGLAMAVHRDQLHEEYYVGAQLGAGCFAEVRMAQRRRDGQTVAVKSIPKTLLADPEDRDGLRDEVNILASLRHPNIVHLLEVHETGDHLHLVTELCAGGELFDRIVERRHYTENDARVAVAAIAAALQHCHRRHIVHRDIKPENLLYATPLPDASLKLADFGFAALLSPTDQEILSDCGTPGYVAPEILRAEPCGKAADVWSLGVVIYILLAGHPPFAGETSPKLFSQILQGRYSFTSPAWDVVSPEALDLIRRILVLDPADRLNIEGVVRHPWMAGTAWVPRGDLRHVQAPLGHYNRTRKLRATVRSVQAMQRMAHQLGFPTADAGAATPLASHARAS